MIFFFLTFALHSVYQFLLLICTWATWLHKGNSGLKVVLPCCQMKFQNLFLKTLFQANCERRKQFRGRNFKPLLQWWHFAIGLLFHKTSSERLKSVGESLVKADSSKIVSLSSFPENRLRKLFLRVGTLRAKEKAQRTRNISPHQEVSTHQLNSSRYFYYCFFGGEAVVCPARAHMQYLSVCTNSACLSFVNKPQTAKQFVNYTTFFPQVHVSTCSCTLLHTKCTRNIQLLISALAWVPANEFILDEKMMGIFTYAMSAN